MTGGEGVSQRRCGTCRYFEEGALAGSGWCRHPQRRDLQHMVLVRKSELACRAGWDEDLWEPRQPQEVPGRHARMGADDLLEAERPSTSERPVTTPVGAVSPTAAARGERAGQTLTSSWTQHHAHPRDVRRHQPHDDHGPAREAPTNALAGRTPGSPGTADEPGTHRPPHDDPRLPTAGSSERDDVGDPARRTPVVEEPRHGWRQSGQTEPFSIPEELSPVPAEDAPESSDGYLVDAAGAGDAPLMPDGGIPGVPQCCRTCRDFRPIADGRQGWCGNPYAFPERSVVAADSLACYSSLGSWWLPNDDWWLQLADISHHGMPTPNVDEYLQQLHAERQAARRRRAGS